MSVKDNLLGSVKRFKRKSIFIKNLRLIALLMMIPLLWVSAVLYFHITSVTFSEAENTNRASLVHTSDLCDLIISDACRIAASGMLDRDVNMAILSEFDTMGMNETDNIISRVNKFISSYTLIYDHIDSIHIYSKKNN